MGEKGPVTLRARAAIVTILAVCTIALGTAGATWAGEPAIADDGQCGAHGDHAVQNDESSCGADPNGQAGTVAGLDTFAVRSTTMVGTDTFSGGSDQQGETQDGQHGAQQDGEFEGDF
jgi:hypothetical protein